MIWRYIDIQRFLFLLNAKNLYLCRLDNFRDSWEGSWPMPVLEGMKEYWPSDAPQSFSEISEVMRKSYFVNCWHENSTESAALWDLYARNSGVAIQSTIGSLKRSVTDTKRYFIGRVRYVNSETEPFTELNLLIPPFLKRKNFENEKEVRLLNWSPTNIKEEKETKLHHNDTLLEIEPNTLIKNLFISPACPEWLVPTPEELCAKFNITAPLYKSSLYDNRVY